MMSRQIDTTFWGTSKQENAELKDEVLNMIGIATKEEWWNKQLTANVEANEAYQKAGLENTKANARQAFHKIKGNTCQRSVHSSEAM